MLNASFKICFKDVHKHTGHTVITKNPGMIYPWPYGCVITDIMKIDVLKVKYTERQKSRC